MKKGYDDAVISNIDGYICECTTSNIFFVSITVIIGTVLDPSFHKDLISFFQDVLSSFSLLPPDH
ncbi:MAG: hypothetical protein Q8N71_01570 [candidate division Zixibacteria bacterium]|nr:hypothetical protein [candidate division Zixibacteria bacterium]